MAAARPAIGWAPGAVGWGESFHVQTSQADRIRRVALIRTGSVTHAWNGDQRFVGCTFQRQGDWLQVKAPPTMALAPPGSYLLVTINDVGIPAPGRFLRVSPPARGSSSLVQSGFGMKGNFELVAPRPSGGLNFWWRNNDAAGLPWSPPQPVATGGGVVEAIPSMLQGNFGGKLEVAARIGNRLALYWRGGATWNGPAMFGLPGVRGNPAMIQSLFGGRGNFELVVPLEGGGIASYWRNNDAPGLPWSAPTLFGSSDGQVDAIALLQSNLGDPGNLEVIARYGTRLALWWRESGPPWRWSGPFYFFDGAAGVPSMVQAKFGAKGNFELVTPLAAGGAAHLWRNNDAAGLPWSGPSANIAPRQQVVAASLMESNFGAPGHGGNLELILRTQDGRNLHYWRVDGPPWTWTGPTATLDRNGAAVSVASAMLETYPKDFGGIDKDKLSACIEACFQCAQACTACADACLGEDMVAELTKCIRTDLDCTDVCEATGRMLSRHTGYDANLSRAVLEACAAACKACGDECESHASMHEHCRVCAQACKRCEQACRDLIAALN